MRSTLPTSRIALSGSKSAGLAQYSARGKLGNTLGEFYDFMGSEAGTGALVSAYRHQYRLREDGGRTGELRQPIARPEWAADGREGTWPTAALSANATFQTLAISAGKVRGKLAIARDAGPVGNHLAEASFPLFGERATRVDGRGLSRHLRLQQAGRPRRDDQGEGTRATSLLQVRGRAYPIAAWLLLSWMHGREGQQILTDYARNTRHWAGGLARRQEALGEFS